MVCEADPKTGPVKNLNELPVWKSCAVKIGEKMLKSAYS